MSLGRTLKSYVFWTYERGSIPYDIMVTLILAIALVRARKPDDPSPRSIHRFRRVTEPWAVSPAAAAPGPARPSGR